MSFTTSTIIMVVIISVVIIILAGIIYYTYNIQKPSSGNCDYIKSSDPSTKWSDDCSYIKELSLDSSLTTPSEPLYLSAFTNSPSLGPSWGANVWYRYNYVNGLTGGYSESSPWTLLPISAGSTNLPCKGGNCSGVKIGKDSCQSNLPTLNIDKLDYPLITGNIYANVYRYTSPISSTTQPTNTTPGKIVGMLVGESSGSASFIDVSSSPCKETTCNNVQGC